MRSLILLVAAGLFAACGGDDVEPAQAADPTTAEVDAPDSTGVAAAGPVTVQHRFGSTELTGTPERIVSLDHQWTDVLLELDANLVGAIATPFTDSGFFPWDEGLLDGVELITATSTEIPYETVAALQPDLIVVSYVAPDQRSYDLLDAIAPTIGLLGDEQVDAWEDMATAAGELLGDPDAAGELIAASEQQSVELLAELPGLASSDYALANYVPGDAIYVVTDPDDGANRVFGQLDMQIDPALVAQADGATGRVELSLEEIGQLDSDLVLLLTNGADPADIPGYEALPAVENGAVAILDLSSATALNTPSPLSVPYALDEIRPALRAVGAP